MLIGSNASACIAILALLKALSRYLDALPAGVFLKAFTSALFISDLQGAHVRDLRLVPMVGLLHLLHGRLVSLGFSTYLAIRLSAHISAATIGLGWYGILQFWAICLSALRSIPKATILASEHVRLQYLTASFPTLFLEVDTPHQKHLTLTTLCLDPLLASEADHLHLEPQYFACRLTPLKKDPQLRHSRVEFFSAKSLLHTG